MKNNLSSSANNIAKILDDKVKTIRQIEYRYYLDELLSEINNLSGDELEIVIEELINDYLKKLKSISNKNNFEKVSRKVDEVLDFFNFSKGENVEEIGDITAEAEDVACELYFKTIGENGRKIELPIDINFIKTYCIRNITKKEELKNTLIWIVLYLSIITQCLTEENK